MIPYEPFLVLLISKKHISEDWNDCFAILPLLNLSDKKRKGQDMNFCRSMRSPFLDVDLVVKLASLMWLAWYGTEINSYPTVP
jgi:hypothetical protein